MSEMVSGAGIYTLRWEDYGLTIVVDRLRENTQHEIHSEWVVKTASHGHLTRSRVSLLGPRSKGDLVKELGSSAAGLTLDWRNIVEEAAGKVLEEFRRGEPVVVMGEVEVSESLEWRVWPFMLEREATLLFGYSGLGKSMFAKILATYVQEGYMSNGIEVEPGNVLYLDYETSPKTAARRFRLIHAGLGIASGSGVRYRHCFQPLASEISEIQKEVHASNIEMVIVDSAGPACGGEPESAGVALGYWNALRSLKVSSLTIAHRAKNSRDGHAGGPFGCYSQDTEVLTTKGWYRHEDITVNSTVACYDPETEELSWQSPSAVHAYSYDGEMVHLTGHRQGGLDILVTPNHRMVVKPQYALPIGTRQPTRNPREWHFKPAEKLSGGQFVIPHSSKGIQETSAVTESLVFARFLGWWLSEGCLDGNVPVLTQAEGALADRMREAVTQLGYEARDWVGRSRPHEKLVMQLRAKGGSNLGRWLRDECGEGSGNKRIPLGFFRASAEIRQALLDALIDGDGSRRTSGRMEYTTCSPQLADGIQVLAITLGYAARQVFRGRAQPWHQDRYAVYMDKHSTRSIRTRNVERVPYRGSVHCLTVPTGAYVTRRNGMMAIAGNSVYWTNIPRAVYEIQKSQAVEADTLNMALVHTNANDTRIQRPHGYSLSFDEDAVHFSVADLAQDDNLKGVLPLHDQMVELLKGGAMEVKEIAELLETKEGSVRTTLNRNRAEQFQKVGTRWGLRERDFSEGLPV